MLNGEKIRIASTANGRTTKFIPSPRKSGRCPRFDRTDSPRTDPENPRRRLRPVSPARGQ